MDIIEKPGLMEPLLPAEGTRSLEDLAVDLVARAARLAGKLAPETISSISTLVRSMNCYYSNLIEGHNTHPVDIERALRGEYSKEPKKRNLQIEALAHIAVQALLDDSASDLTDIVSRSKIQWLHREFCNRLPPSLLSSRDPRTDSEKHIIPGALRDSEVLVGTHLAPVARELPKFFDLFEQRYDPANLSAVMRVLAVAASHHRLLWIHPFLDGNGRVARLFSHAFFKSIGIGSGLWSVSRGLARNVDEYKNRLAAADMWRCDDTDGRGSLSLRALNEFCEFFLATCVDQVSFMETLLEPALLIERARKYCAEQIESKVLHRGSFEVLRELILSGAIPRARLTSITGYQERQARKISASLIANGLVRAASPKADLHLSIPHNAVEAWFPRLYPAV
jgi:Fic family protein